MCTSKFCCPTYDKNSPESGHRGNTYLNTRKAICDESTSNIIPEKAEKLKAVTLNQEQDKDVHSSHFFFPSIVLEVLAAAIREEKEIKSNPLEKK